MPIVIGGSSSSTSLTTMQVQDIMDCAMHETQDAFAAGGSTSILIEYVDRIHKQVIRKRRWTWMLSPLKIFITKIGQTEYWIGPTAGQSAGQVDTGLNLTDVYDIETSMVQDTSNFRDLYRVPEPPMLRTFQTQDGQYRLSRLKQWRNDVKTPNVLSLYPAPDNGNTYEMIPEPPITTTGSGGALSQRMYFVKVAFVDQRGNVGAASGTATRAFVDASNLITVKAPQPPIGASTDGVGYTKYNVYIGTTEGSETKQNISPVLTSVDWTEPTSGLITGTAAPTNSDLEPLYGYLVHFQYYKKISDLTAVTDTLQIPDRYRDVVCAGVRSLGYSFLRDEAGASEWNEIYNAGIKQMIVDQGPWPAGSNFIQPDVATQINRWYSSGTIA